MLRIRNLINLVRPVQIFFCMLTYWFGLGLAHYLGAAIQMEPQIIGLGLFLLVFAASNLLTEYFRNPNHPFFPEETRKNREEFRSMILIAGILLLVFGSILIYILIKDGFFFLEASVILVLFLFLAISRFIPPFRLANRGLAELSASIEIASLSPGLAFLLQFGKFHRALTLFTFPMLLLALAYFMACNFPSYSTDLKYERRSILISLTWQKAVTIHNMLLVIAYLFLAGIPFLGIPFGLVWPAFLTLPLAIYQVFSMRNLAEGGKPIWPIFTATAAVIFGLTTYLLSLTFWLR